MLKERREAALAVAEKLRQFEDALDAALVAAGELVTALPKARMQAHLSAVVGQDAVDSVAEALASVHAARASAVRGHHQLAEAHKQIGLGVYAGGMGYKIVDNHLKSHLYLIDREAA